MIQDIVCIWVLFLGLELVLIVVGAVDVKGYTWEDHVIPFFCVVLFIAAVAGSILRMFGIFSL